MTEYTIRLILSVDKKRESYYNERNHTDGKQAVKRGRSRCGDEKNEQTEQAHADFYLLSAVVFLIDTDFSIVSLNDSDFVHWTDSDYLKFQRLA